MVSALFIWFVSLSLFSHLLPVHLSRQRAVLFSFFTAAQLPAYLSVAAFLGKRMKSARSVNVLLPLSRPGWKTRFSLICVTTHQLIHSVSARRVSHGSEIKCKITRPLFPLGELCGSGPAPSHFLSLVDRLSRRKCLLLGVLGLPGITAQCELFEQIIPPRSYVGNVIRGMDGDNSLNGGGLQCGHETLGRLCVS